MKEKKMNPSMESTLYSVVHIERLTRSLHQIMQVELKRPLSIEICLRVVCAGLSLFRKSDLVPSTYCGRPWSTTGALYRLAGEGYVFNPRLALLAIELLQARHIVDRRRIEYRDAPRKTVPVHQPQAKRRLGRAA